LLGRALGYGPRCDLAVRIWASESSPRALPVGTNANGFAPPVNPELSCRR
jgi:hypothetical protein